MLLAMGHSHLRVAFLPWGRATLKALRKLPFTRQPNTLGQHLRKRRYELRLWQKEVAERLGVDESTYANWEKDRTSPAIRYMAALIQFLGYDPINQGNGLGARLLAFRRRLGLARRLVAARLGVDLETLARIEWGIRNPTARVSAAVERFIAEGGKS